MRDFARVSFLVLAFSYPAIAMAQAGWSGVGNMHAEAGQLFALANQARAEAGAGQLKWDSALAAAALTHCRRMAAEGPISHQYQGELGLVDRAGQAGAHFSVIEENVAEASTAGMIQAAWMHSPGHRTNMLSPNVNRIGIAVVRARGVLYAVEDFALAVPVLSRSQVEESIANLIRATGVAILRDSSAARESCALSSGFGGTTRPGYTVRWQAADISQLPQSLVERLSTGQYRQAAVGSCPASSSAGAFTAFRVAVLLY